MTEDENRKFQSLNSCFEQAWEQFNARRETEFKMSVSLWTALVIGIGGSMTVPDLPTVPGGHLTMIFVALLTVILHALWLSGLNRAQAADFNIARDYEKQMHLLLQFKFSDDTREQIVKVKAGGALRLPKWSPLFQVGVTVVFLATLLLSVWGKTAGVSTEEIRKLEFKKLQLEVGKLSQELESIKVKLAINDSCQSIPMRVSKESH